MTSNSISRMAPSLFLFSLIVCLQVQGQDVTNGLNVGFPMNGDFSGSSFESTQTNNGNLHIEIPVVSEKGRGLGVALKYVYDNKGWSSIQHCLPKQGSCNVTISTESGNTMQFPLVGPFGYKVTFKSIIQVCSPGTSSLTFTDYVLREPNGTKHHFGPHTTTPGGNTCWPALGTKLYADDGSGYVLNVSTGNDGFSQGQVKSAVGKDGTSLLGTAPGTAALGTVEDSNGNQLIPGTPSTNPGTDTLGRAINTDGSYYDSSGVLRSIQITTQSVAIQTALCSFQTDPCTEYSSTWNLPHIITLPNGMTYRFTYDQGSPTHPYYGEPLSVTLPTGGTITWGWGATTPSGRVLASRQLSGDPNPWTYTPCVDSAPVGQTSTGKITDPAGNDTVITCTYYVSPYAQPQTDGTTLGIAYVTKKQYYQGSSTSGQLLKTLQTDYQTGTVPAVLPIHETTTWNPQNLVSRTETDYDSWAGWTFNGTNNVTASNPIAKREYGFGSGTWGALIRTTNLSYLHLDNSAYRGTPNILDKLTMKKVFAGPVTGTLMAWTQNTYDGVAIPANGNTSANPAPNHDYANFPASYNLRGNLTQSTRELKSGSGSWSGLNTNYTYNDLGEILTTTDPLSHQTTYDYTDNWATINNPQCVTSAHSYGFRTTITDPLGHRLKHQYFSCTSLVGSDQDENDIQASRPGITYAYDKMSRLASKSLPDGGSVTYTPNDTSLPYSVMGSTLVDPNSSLYIVGTTVFDGLGRVQQNQKHDPDCTAGLVKVDHTYSYGTQGRMTQVSTPYCNSPGGSYGLITTTNSDALERPVSVQQSDGSTSSTSYAGNCQTTIDEAGKSRTSCSDALGRLTQVLEDPGASPHLNYETDYGYDVLDNMTSVTQKGGAGSSSWRNRSFTYDSLSRLTCAANPEVTSGLGTVNPASCPATDTGTYTVGTIGYTYDLDSEVLTKIAPAPNQTGTATVTTTYSYNQDHQLLGISYSDGTTPSAKFGYNGTAITSGCTTTPPTLTDSNPVHARTSMCDGSGATSWAHDPMGRVLTEKRTIVGASAITNTIAYLYFKDGELNKLTNPNSNRQVTYTANGSGGYTAGRPISVVDTTNSINFATGATYAPHGAMASLTIGASVNGAETYNARLQPLQMYYTVGTISSGTLTQLQQPACPTTAATIMSRSYNFGQGSNDNGTVQTITNCLDTNRTQNFVYDALNRIQQAYTSGPNWGETFGSAAAPGVAPSTPGIDAWGNLWQRSGVTGKTYYEALNCPANIKNQLTACSTGYDSAGNMTSYGTATYTYDGENRLLTTAGVTYTYDGDGKRVKKSNGMLYWTGTGSDALLETDLSGNPTAEYVFFGGRRIARVDRPANSVDYYYADHLGSTDVVTNATGVKVKESDYYPYGGEIPIITGDSNRYKFNGKERDSESGLDNFGARYDASNLGRFMTPDWAERATAVPYAVFGDPQSLNLYGYVRNDPLSRADADGHVDDAIKTCAKVACTTPGQPLQQSSKAQQPAQNKSWLQKALSFFYVKTGNGKGIGLNDVKVGPAKADVIFRSDGKEAKHTTEGKTITTVNSEIGVKVQLGPVKVGVERTDSQEEGSSRKVEWLPVFAMGKFEGSNAEIGVGAGGCFVLCGQIEGGIQADKVLNAIGDAFSNYVTSRIDASKLAPTGGDPPSD